MTWSLPKGTPHEGETTEATALRESIRDGDLAWESTVMAAHHRLHHTPSTDSQGHLTEEWDRAHREFHHVLLAGGRSRTLTEVATGELSAAEKLDGVEHGLRTPVHRVVARDGDDVHVGVADGKVVEAGCGQDHWLLLESAAPSGG